MKTHPTKSKSKQSTTKKGVPWRLSAEAEFSKYTETGAMLRAGRFKAGLTQKQLAEMLEILPHHISEMEHGKRAISKKMAQKLGKIFDLDYRIFL